MAYWSYWASCHGDNDLERWDAVINSGDEKIIWQLIGWNGDLQKTNEIMTPTNATFKEHFDTLPNSEDQQTMNETASECPYIPILDDPITPIEVEDTLKKTKTKGYIGNCPSVLQWLPQKLCHNHV